jgi:hypothetical protein
VLVQRANVMAATFHPELTQDSTVHRLFLELIAASPRRSASVAGQDPITKETAKIG